MSGARREADIFTLSGHCRGPLAVFARVLYNRATVTSKPYSAKQGQYLAFIFYYTKIHGHAPAEADMQRYFRVSRPTLHQRILTLESRGLIEPAPGDGPSIRLMIHFDLAGSRENVLQEGGLVAVYSRLR